MGVRDGHAEAGSLAADIADAGHGGLLDHRKIRMEPDYEMLWTTPEGLVTQKNADALTASGTDRKV
jgi:hypothetical protein